MFEKVKVFFAVIFAALLSALLWVLLLLIGIGLVFSGLGFMMQNNITLGSVLSVVGIFCTAIALNGIKKGIKGN